MPNNEEEDEEPYVLDAPSDTAGPLKPGASEAETDDADADSDGSFRLGGIATGDSSGGRPTLGMSRLSASIGSS